MISHVHRSGSAPWVETAGEVEMICKKCGYRNDFIDECPFHEPPVAERIKAIRARKAVEREIQELIKQKKKPTAL